MPLQYRPEWNIPGAGPSISVLNMRTLSLDDQGAVNEIRSFFNAIAALIPNDVLITFPGVLSVLDAVTGQLTAEVTVTSPASVTGGGTLGWAGGVGALVQWDTGVIIGGRRQRGRTFLVPLAASVFDTNGTLTGSAQATLEAAAEGLIAGLDVLGSELVVWSRKNGVETNVAAATIPDRSAILRDRRDG